MADGEAEQDRCAQSSTSAAAAAALRERLQELAAALKDSPDSPEQSASQYCQDFCQTLVEYAGRWRIEQDPLPLMEVYTVALLSYARATPCLSSRCENVSIVLERLTLSCVELLLSLPQNVPSALWEEFQSSVQAAHTLLQRSGNSQLCVLSAVAQQTGVWAHPTLRRLLSQETPETKRVHEFLALEGPVLSEMRIKHLIKESQVAKATLLAKACSEYPGFEGKGHFKQTYLVCLCATEPQESLMQELSKVDCRDALEMICNLESDGDEKGALCLCSAFLTRQLLQGDMYCAWELTLFWSKLLKRLESSPQTFLDRCRQMSLLSKTVYHILFLIKVIQSEMDDVGLPVCIELCIRALQMESSDSGNTKATICKTISCLLPSDLEVKRACQLTEFLLEPTVDSYYAVETLYNEPDQKLEEESLSVPNSLRCELLLVFKTQWPFDPEFWDWKTLKRHCLALMGEEASIVSSIDELNDSENPEGPEDEDAGKGLGEYRDQTESFWDTTNELNEMEDERKKKREIKKLREKGFISARFRNWQAYMQYCVLCDKEFLGHRIVRHAQTHVKDGVYSCPICADTFDSKEVLMPHVASHVKQSCKERLAAMKTSKKLASASKAANPDSAALKDKAKAKDGLNSDDGLDANNDENYEALRLAKAEFSAVKADGTEEYTCPVVNCRKGFKYYRNLIAHVKAHRNSDEAKRYLEMQSKKVVCHYCRRQFVSVTHLNDHLQVHCGVRPYICIQLNCKASFVSSSELLVHRKEHAVFKAKCMFPDCGRVFNEAYMLYDHEAQHYKTFTCKTPGCGKIFHAQSQLDLHQEEHVKKEEDPPSPEGQTPLQDKAEPQCGSDEQEPNHSACVNAELPHDQASRLQGAAEQSSSSSADEVSSHPRGPVKVKHSVENMLNPAQGPMHEPEHSLPFKTEPPDLERPSFPLPCSDGSINQSSVNTHSSGSNQPELPNSASSLLYDLRNVASQGLTIPPVPHPCVIQETRTPSHPNMLQGQAQLMFPNDQNALPSEGNEERNRDSPNCTGPVPAQHSGMFLPNHPATNQAPHHMSAMIAGIPPRPASQAVLPQTVPLPAGGAGMTNAVSQPPCNTSAVHAEGEKERHNCAFETCTRNYSSYRSVTKHMKAAHPEFYVEWKLAKRNNKLAKTGVRNMSAGGKSSVVTASQDSRGTSLPVPVTQMRNIAGQPLPYPAGCPNPAVSNSSFSTHSAPVTSQSLPNQMENILNPILLSQLGGSPNQPNSVQSQIGPSLPWPAQPGNNPDLSQQASCPPHMMTSHMQALPSQPFSSHINTSSAGRRIDPQHSEVGRSSLQGPHSETADPFLQSQVDSGSRLSQTMSGESLHPSCVSDFTGAMIPGAPPQMEMANQGFGHIETPGQIMPSNMDGLANSLLTSAMDNMPHPVLPSYLGSLKDPVLSDQLDNSANSLFPPQNQNSSFSNFNSPDRMISAQLQNNIQSDYPAQGNSNLQINTDVGPPESMNASRMDGINTAVTKTKRNKRAKWPAIIKDGKFICCRCFREFPSPKSLGGHLSKRSHCKAFDETDLTADLPTSFLDLLNSPHVLNTHQQPVSSSFSPNAAMKDHPGHSLASCHLEPRFFPNVSFPQANGSAYSNDGEQNEEVLKQVLDNPAIPNLFESSGIPQQTYQNPCGSYPPDGCLPESTVIQHTGNLQNKTDTESHREDFIKSDFGNSDFSDPLLSQLLSDNNSAVSLNSLPTDHLNQILRAETLMKLREVKGNGGDPQPGALSNDGLLAAMASLAQNLMTNPLLQITSPDPQKPPLTQSTSQDDSAKKKSEKNVKKKLREQILAGDISRRGNLPQVPNADTNASMRNCELQSPPAGVPKSLSGGSQTSEPSTAIQITSNGERGAGVSSGVAASVPPPQSDGAVPSQARPNGDSSQTPETSVLGGTLTNDDNPAVAPSPTNEDRMVIEIQRALERLDLNSEVSEDAQLMNNSSSNDVISNNIESLMLNSTVANDMQVPESFVKPFACESEGCNYRAMTKDALFKHLSKTHSYTDEMIIEIKKNHGKFAPFRCQMCSKTFTRNSNLRAHCQTVHSLSHEEMVKLKIKRQCNKKPEMEVSNHQVGTVVSTPTCVQHTASVNHAAANENIMQQCASTDGRQERLDVPSVQNQVYTQEWVKQEYQSQTFEKQSPMSLAVPELPQDNCHPVGLPVQPAQSIPMNKLSTGGQAPQTVAVIGYPMEGQSAVIAPVVDQCSQGQHAAVPSIPGQCLAGPPPVGFAPAGSSPVRQVSTGLLQSEPIQTGTSFPEKTKKPKVTKPRTVKPKTEKTDVDSQKKPKEKKPVGKSSEAGEGFSPYRPYRCVHQGCVAAFTIQHNLILHYRAVHQSALPKFEENSEDEPEDQQEEQQEVKKECEVEAEELTEVNEFRCQVKDCSRIFQMVTSLLQHYLQLHKFTLDKAGALMSTINLGRFQCDQPDCSAFFTAFWKYIGHIETDHKEAKLSKVEPVEGLFRCEVEGCDRAYATRSNLLRHTMKKHHDLYKLQLMKQRRDKEREKLIPKRSQISAVKNNNEKENMQDNKKPIQKGQNDKKKSDEEKSNHWTKYGKPSLKSKEEASSMCTKKFPLQYPCMIKGCESVVSSERNILRHYIRHGLAERYLEEQRSHFIFCKKFSRSRYRDRFPRSDDTEKSEDSSTESSENEDGPETEPRGSETESSKPASGKEEPELSDFKQSTDESSESKSVASVVVKRKRGRPPKASREEAAPVSHRKTSERLRVTRSNAVSCLENGSDSAPNAALAQEKQPEQTLALSSFKPMGFEVSFLKFLEESTEPTRPPKRPNSEDISAEIALKRHQTIQLKTATVLCKRSDVYIQPRDTPNRIDFKNPQKITSLKNVKIVVDKTFSKGMDHLLKQLQEMRPIVILQK
ncbi:zinc finger protein 292b [Megalops cyprinoides]|uniref:zinc finger protein 292b n=1 Tax=Megalops cyprinoides TaxID=118141 RepID=UPI00186530D4|nr:zinc finger protein 292b [Megalops cyprinoides]